MTVILGADHAGFSLKEKLKQALTDADFVVVDAGAKTLDKNDDYPDYAIKVANRVGNGQGNYGILVCGSGAGVCIAANKIKNIRAVAVTTAAEAKLTREHNDANVLCLSGWNLSLGTAKKIVLTWLKTPFSGEARHARRIKKIADLEN